MRHRFPVIFLYLVLLFWADLPTTIEKTEFREAISDIF